MNQHPKCECHECTQARWKMHAGGGLAQQWAETQKQPDTLAQTYNPLAGQAKNVPSLPVYDPTYVKRY